MRRLALLTWLLQEVFDTLNIQHADAEFFQFGCGSGGQPLIRPIRNWAEALLDQTAKDFPFAFQFAFLKASLKLASQNFVLQDVNEKWHLSSLPLYRLFQVPESSQNQQLAQSALPFGRRQTSYLPDNLPGSP